MKKLFICLAILGLFPLLVISQPITIDTLKYRVTYDVKSVNDTTQVPYLYKEDEMRLDIGKNDISVFYSYSVQYRNQIIQSQLASDTPDWDQIPKKGSIGWMLYKNYPEKGRTLTTEQVGMTEYQCDEPEEYPTWSLVADSTTVILDYECQQAITWFKGRKWVAWYAEDIPLNEGPWKLWGLPGLVLRAHDSQRQYCFEGIGLEQCETQEQMTFIPSKRERVSQKDLRKLKRSYSLTDELKGRGFNVEYSNLKEFKQQLMINPIDLDE